MHIGKISTAFLSLTSSRRKQRRTHSNFNLLEATQVKELAPLEAQTMICIPNKNSEIEKEKTIVSISSSSYVPHIVYKVSIRSTIPQGICIEDGPLGKKLVATQNTRFSCGGPDIHWIYKPFGSAWEIRKQYLSLSTMGPYPNLNL